MQRGTNHAEQSNDENGRKLARNKTMWRRTNYTEQRKWSKISKGTKPCTREQIGGTTEQTNEGNVRFFVQNSPTSEAGQNFDQFISPTHPKHCTKS
jgi:hypothetical protein